MLSTQAIDINDISHAGQIAANFIADPATKLRDLGAWHDDLDLAIRMLAESGHHDDLAIARLKKRKLQIRDELAGVAAQSHAEAVPAPGSEAPPVSGDAALPDMARTTAQSPGALSGLLMFLAVVLGGWAVLEVAAVSAREIYASLLILALLGAGG